MPKPFTQEDFTADFCQKLVAEHGSVTAASRFIAPKCASLRYPDRPLAPKTISAWITPHLQPYARRHSLESPPPSFASGVVNDEPLVFFPDAKQPDVDWEATLLRHGSIAKARDGEELKQRHATIDLTQHGDEPVCIVQMSDIHIGSPQCDVDALIRHIKLLKSIPNLYSIIDGDIAEWAISPRMLDAVLGQVGSPQEQVRVFGAILKDLAEKCLVLVTGNHDERGFRMGGVDVFEFLVQNVKKHGVYLRDGGMLRIKLAGDVEYTWRVSHGDGLRGGSMYSQTAAMARNARHEVGFADVASGGHIHDPEVRVILEPRSDGSMMKQQSIYLRSASYKVLGDEQYPDRMGYAAQPYVVMPAVVFYPHQKRVIPFFRVEDAAEYLQALKSKPARKAK